MPGSRAVVVTDGDRGLAERLRDELLDRAWVEREAFVYQIEPLRAIGRARQGDAAAAAGRRPDRAARPLRQLRLGRHDGHDRVLAEILRQGLDNVAAFAIYDPASGASRRSPPASAPQVTLSIGGKIAMPAIPAESPPLTVTGTVKTISNGRYRNRGPMARGVATDMGPSVVLDTGKVEIALISRHVEPSDLNCLFSLGIDPMQKRYVMLKSRIHWRAGLGRWPRRSSTAPGSASAPRITAS